MKYVIATTHPGVVRFAAQYGYKGLVLPQGEVTPEIARGAILLTDSDADGGGLSEEALCAAAVNIDINLHMIGLDGARLDRMDDKGFEDMWDSMDDNISPILVRYRMFDTSSHGKTMQSIVELRSLVELGGVDPVQGDGYIKRFMKLVETERFEKGSHELVSLS